MQPIFGCGLQQVYGMAEGLLCYTRLDDPDEVVEATQGRPKISAEEVENHLYVLAAVQHAAVIAIPDERTGERICACVVLHPGTTLDLSDVRAIFTGIGVARYKIPAQLEILDALPLTPARKIDKKTLREWFAEQVKAR